MGRVEHGSPTSGLFTAGPQKQQVSPHVFPLAWAAGEHVHTCSICVNDGHVCMPLAKIELSVLLLAARTEPSPLLPPPVHKAGKVGELWSRIFQKVGMPSAGLIGTTNFTWIRCTYRYMKPILEAKKKKKSIKQTIMSCFFWCLAMMCFIFLLDAFSLLL